jgi:all-trans-retinol 13,14-reductase
MGREPRRSCLLHDESLPAADLEGVSMKPGDNHYDAIIIGAGIGGLVTGSLLAKKGQRVLILEKHSQVGGYVTSYQRQNYPLDVVHVLGGLKDGQPIDRIFRYLGLYERAKFNEVAETFVYKFPGYSISCYTDLEKYRAELEAAFPQERGNIAKILGEMSEVWHQIMASYYDPNLRQWLTYPLRFPKLARYRLWSFERFLSQFTTSHRLKKVLSAGWGYNGLNLSRISALQMIGMLMSYHFGGAWYPKGGYQNLSDALAEISKGFGGMVKTSTRVARIIVKNKTAAGVRTDKGEELFAESIVSNADTKSTFLNLIDKEFVPGKIRKKVAGYRQSVSGFVVHLVVDPPIPEELSCGCVMYFPSFDTDEHQFGLWERGQMELDTGAMGFGLAVSTLKDKEMVPDGKHVLDLIYMPAPYEYFKKEKKEDYRTLKEDIAQRMIKAAENLIPELGKHVIVKDVSTPLTYERYTGATEGGWYDIDCSPKQAFFGRIRNKTPIRGLYLTGAKTIPGSGMFGSIQAGLFTADSILRGELSGGKMMLGEEKGGIFIFKDF